jgi:hypothetical protein
MRTTPTTTTTATWIDDDGAEVDELVPLRPSQLRLVGGAADASANANNDAFGRCGPGTSWKWLGDVYTPQCAAHDAKVRGYLANGSSGFMAHAKSLPLLPAAVGSYVRARVTGR